MTFRLILSTVFAICYTQLCCYAQNDRVLSLTDSALSILGMTRADMAMPSDLLQRDIHRMPFHDTLFTNPLQVLSSAEICKKAAISTTEESRTALIKWAYHSLGLTPTPYRRFMFNGRLGGQEIDAITGFDANAKLNNVGASVFYRCIGAVAQASENTEKDLRQFQVQKTAISLADSLWMNSTDDEDATVWELAEKEISSKKKIVEAIQTSRPEYISSVMINGVSLYEHLLEAVRDMKANATLLTDSITTTVLQTPFGRVAIGGAGNDIYTGSFAAIIDIGGNDMYLLSDSTKQSAFKTPIRIIVDMSGTDYYNSGGYSIGAGIGGIGIVIDCQGNDTYLAKDFSLGCGLFGVGILHDFEGSDTYSSASNTQGCGIYGLGMLIDDNGSDTYRCYAQGQAFGGTRGVGFLFDRNGNDQYLAASPYQDVLRYDNHQVTFTQGAALGQRPYASGGLGVLVDVRGNDLYVSDIYGQASGYWFALGMLLDLEGEDRYQSYQYAQGAGVHFATGLLDDGSGNDVYVSHGVSMGCGHDIALGALIDRAGDDMYAVDGLSLGGGNANAVSLFVDEQGNDSYSAINTSNTLGFSDFRRSYGFIGVFVDGNGSDVYTAASNNGSSSTKSSYGVFLDMPTLATLPGTPAQTSVATGAVVADTLPNSTDSLFILASAAPLRFQPQVIPAREKIANQGKAAVEELLFHFNTEMPRERLTLEDVLPKIWKQDSVYVDSILIAEMNTENAQILGMCCTIAGKVKSKAFVPALLELSTSENWKSRRLAAATLGDIGDTTCIPRLIELLQDNHEYVRSRAAYSLGRIGGKDALVQLTPLLSSPKQLVRFGAAEGIARGEKRTLSSVLPIINQHLTTPYLPSTLRLISSVEQTDTNAALWKEYVSSLSSAQHERIITLLNMCEPFWTTCLSETTTPPVVLQPMEPKKKKKKKKSTTL